MTDTTAVPDWAIVRNDKLVERLQKESRIDLANSMGRSEETFRSYLYRQSAERVTELEKFELEAQKAGIRILELGERVVELKGKNRRQREANYKMEQNLSNCRGAKSSLDSVLSVLHRESGWENGLSVAANLKKILAKLREELEGVKAETKERAEQDLVDSFKPTRLLDERLTQAIADIEAGNCDTVHSVDELLEYIDDVTKPTMDVEGWSRWLWQRSVEKHDGRVTFHTFEDLLHAVTETIKETGIPTGHTMDVAAVAKDAANYIDNWIRTVDPEIESKWEEWFGADTSEPKEYIAGLVKIALTAAIEQGKERPEAVTCPTCHGSGHAYKSESSPSCGECKGNGEIFQTKEKK